MEQLNNLEIEILNAIIEENENHYPFLKLHVPYLVVTTRICTGVGMYFNFEYISSIPENSVNILLTSSKRLIIDRLQNEVTYVLDITFGKISFLEIIANGGEMINKECLDNFELLSDISSKLP